MKCLSHLDISPSGLDKCQECVTTTSLLQTDERQKKKDTNYPPRGDLRCMITSNVCVYTVYHAGIQEEYNKIKKMNKYIMYVSL